MISRLLALLASGPGSWAVLGGGIIALVGTAWGAVVWHDRAVEQALIARQEATAARKTIQDQQAALTALSTFTAQQQAAAKVNAAALQEIANAPATRNCVDTPALSAFLRGVLRGNTPAPTANPDSAGTADPGAGAGTD